MGKKGSIVVIVPNANSLHRRMGLAMGAISHLKELQEHDHRFGHRRYYDLPALREHVEAAGLQVELDALFEVARQAPDWSAEIVILCRPRSDTA